MSNQSEVDYDKQFQEDLAKATALSLEQQVLDDCHRAKKYGTAAHYYSERAQTQSPTFQQQQQHTHSLQQRQQSTESAKAFYAQLRTRYQQSRGNSNDLATTTPPIPPSRRHSEANNNISLNVAAVTAASRERSKTPPATLPENDLISFSSPTAKEAQPNTLEKLIEDLQKLQTATPQTALVPFGPVAATPITPMHAAASYRQPPPLAATPQHNAAALQHYAAAAGGAAAANSMQLVPFTPTQQQQKVPLTSEGLQKLYNMPLQQQQQQQQYYQQQQQLQQQYMAAIMPPGVAYTAAQARAGYVPTVGGFAAPTHAANYTQSAPATAAAAAAFTPPQFPSTVSPYGFQYGVMPGNSTPYYGTAHMSAAPASAASAGNIAAAAAPLPLAKSQSAAAAIVPNGSNGGAAGLRRQTPPARKPQRTGNDLIDLSQEDDSRVSVLEAFDPLLNADEEVWKK